jgi:tryptophan synthase, alpha subunit
LKKIAKESEGFLYIVSSLGVTGVRSEINTDISTIVNEAKVVSKTPCAVGFGISTPEQAAKIAEIADGVIVGSAIVRIIEKYGENASKHIYEYVKQMKEAVAR